jgi:hypothetical protein
MFTKATLRVCKQCAANSHGFAVTYGPAAGSCEPAASGSSSDELLLHCADVSQQLIGRIQRMFPNSSPPDAHVDRLDTCGGHQQTLTSCTQAAARREARTVLLRGWSDGESTEAFVNTCRCAMNAALNTCYICASRH